jgi:transposase
MEPPACPGCPQCEQRIAALEAQVRDLAEQLRRLQGRNASNSSLPPSANPPAAPKPVTKELTGRKPGGQPGHAARQRLRLPDELVRRVQNYFPAACERCRRALPEAAGAADPEPTWHQVIDLPQRLVDVAEHRGHARTCGGCGHVTRAVIPAAVRAHGYTPRFSAVVGTLTGVYHLSKRDAAGVIQTILGVPLAVGTVAALEQELSAALADAHAEAARAAQAAPVKNLDETSWKLGGKLAWLWAVVTATCTYFLIHPRRSAAAFHAAVGPALRGIAITDRWRVYDRLPVRQRQLCWAHLVRDFQALYETTGPGQPIGNDLLCFAEDVFTDWYRVRDGTLQRSTFRQSINRQRPWLRARLAAGAACGCAKTAALCRNLLAWEPALWTFARVAGVEPTNNAAERALRKAVLWRKRSFGCKSEAGCRFVARMLTVAKTLGQHQRRVFDYLTAALTAHRRGQPAPALLPA